MAFRLRSGIRALAGAAGGNSSRASRIVQGRKGKKWVALWGNGDHGRLGLAAPKSRWEPVLCRALERHEPRAVACGGAHTLILTDEGRVFAAGLNTYGQLGVPLSTESSLDPVEVQGLPDPCVHIAAGDHHSAAITIKGDTYLWGKNEESQLGLGKEAQLVHWKPQRLEALAGFRLKMLALGCEHSLGLTETGEVLSWGADRNGCLGHGRVSSFFRYFQDRTEYSPRLINCLEDLKIHKVAAGLLHSACVDEDGTVFMFGQGRLSQLGLGDNRDSVQPSPVRELPRVTEIACGGYHTGVTTKDGDVYMWGSNEYGCLGFGYGHQPETSTPVKVESLEEAFVSQISCGWKHTAIITDGQIFTWGWGGSQGTHGKDGDSTGGQLGLGNEFDYLEPMLVETDGLVALEISCGFNHTGAILEES